MSYPVEKLSASIGAEIKNIDLNRLTDQDIAFVRQALTDHLVLVFRGQTFEAASLYQLASQFGQPAPYPFVDGVEGIPEVVKIEKLPRDTVNFGGVWHSDTAYMAEPAMGAFLYAIEVPNTGGDTFFSNMYAAYESLSPGLKKFLEPLQATNDADKAAISQTRPGQMKKGLVADHPVIRTHPETGRKLLYVDRAHTTTFVGMTEAESQPLLNHLFDLIEKPDISFALKWQPGTVAFWDNRACQHYPVNDYNGQYRSMLRVSLAGTRPV